MKYLVVFFLSISLNFAHALSLKETEDSIAYYHSQIIKVPTDNERLELCAKMSKLFIASFEDNSVFDYPFDKIQFCKIISSDKRVRLLNWNLPYTDGTHTYYCFVLIRNDKKDGFEWVELKDLKNEPENLEGQVLKSNKWLGALYYEIIPMEKKNCKKYTLLGWDGKDNLSTRKIIEVMNISGKNVRFGDDVFQQGDNIDRKRIILEYSDEVSAALKYYPDKQTIVLDQLAPKSPVVEGIYSEYGPLGNYNMYQLNKGVWELHKDIDVSKFTTNEGRPYNDPSKLEKRKL